MPGIPSDIVLRDLPVPPIKGRTAPIVATDPGRRDGSRGGNPINPPLNGAAFFEDSFETGDLSKSITSDSSSWSWGGGTVDTDDARTGSNSLSFIFGPDALGEDSFRETSFRFGKSVSEIWLEYYIKIPANFFHRSDAPSNNKFLQLNFDDSTYQALTVEFEPRGDGTSSLRRFLAASENPDGSTNWPTSQYTVDKFIGPAGQGFPITLGNWHQIRVHFKSSTNGTGADGRAELWVDGVLLRDLNWPFWKVSTSGQINGGYLMGWSNSGYTDATEIRIDDVKVYDTDPGWSHTAEQVFALSFSGDTVSNQGVGNAQPGGGYIEFLANPENGAGDGIGGTNISVVDITGSSAYPSGVKGLRNTYKAGGAAYSFGNQTIFLKHPEMQRFYMRTYVRFSANWQWGNDQLKFCKNKGTSGVSTNCPKFDSAGIAHITKLAPANPSLNELFVYPVATGAQSDYNTVDDINNGFGAGGTDANWTPTLGQEHLLEWEIDAGTPGQSDGSYKFWVDGGLYMQLDNVQVAQSGDTLFTTHELGHVWQNGSPTEDIYVDFYGIEIHEHRPADIQDYTPLLTQNFEGTLVGATATEEWYNATYTDEQSKIGTRALKLTVPSFEVGTCPTIWSDWYFGNRITLPQIVTKGHTLWMRLWLFIPDTFSWGYVWSNTAGDEAEYDACAATHGLSTSGHDGNTSTKWLSMDPDNTNGRAYLNVPAARRVTTDPSSGHLMLVSEQSQDPTIVEDYAVPTGRWVSHQLAVHLQDDNTGWMRFWENDVLVAEKLNIQTLDVTDTGIHKAGMGNYWNGLHYTDGQPGRDAFYLDDVIFATDMPGFGAPTGRDAAGNAYIPTTHTAEGFN